MFRNLLSLSVLGIILFGLSSCDKESIQSESEIPAEVISYVTAHFPGHTILQSIKDQDGFTLTYDVTLSENVFLEFNRQKEIIQVESNEKLPDSVLPLKILEYTNTNYSGNFIILWEKEGKNQQIELNNGLELLFDNSGNFLRIDN